MNTPDLQALIELLPCPFCGAPGEFMTNSTLAPLVIATCSGDCDLMPATGVAEKGAAITAWNTRQPAPTLPGAGGGDALELEKALRAVLPYVATEVVGCHGDKCREPWCYSCFGDEEAASAVAKASEACKVALAALPPQQGG